jgi:hypothetical protein
MSLRSISNPDNKSSLNAADSKNLGHFDIASDMDKDAILNKFENMLNSLKDLKKKADAFHDKLKRVNIS